VKVGARVAVGGLVDVGERTAVGRRVVVAVGIVADGGGAGTMGVDVTTLIKGGAAVAPGAENGHCPSSALFARKNVASSNTTMLPASRGIAIRRSLPE
jgi:hypothetical protein